MKRRLLTESLGTEKNRLAGEQPVVKDGLQLSAVDRVCDEIKKKIRRGEFLPGMRLVEADLTEELKVSRVTIRPALSRLISDDLVELIPHRGFRVRQASYKDVMDIYTVREYNEGLAARLAAQQPKENLRSIEEAFLASEQAVEANDMRRHTEMSTIFHSAIAIASGNSKLVSVLDRMNTSLIVFQFMAYFRRVNLVQTQKSHQEILTAILNGDGDLAESLMRAHIRYNKEMLEEAYRSNCI